MSSSITAPLAQITSCVALFSCCLYLGVVPFFATLFQPNLYVAPAKVRRIATSSAQKTSTGIEGGGVIGKIAFASDLDGNFEIYLMDSDGGGQLRLTEKAAIATKALESSN